MKAIKWMGCFGVILLVASLMWTTGCGGSDGDGESSTVVVTNDADGTTVVVTNAVPEATLLAPQLIQPTDGQIFTTLKWNGLVTIPLNWAAVPEATSYQVWFGNGSSSMVSGTSSSIEQGIGKWTWRVRAIDSEGTNGAWSPWFNFEVQLISLQPAP